MPPRPLLWLLLTLAVGLATPARAATYYWVGASGANWSAASSWNTVQGGNLTANNRTTPDGSDVLIFSGGTPNVTMDTGLIITPELITRLQFTGNTNATLTVTTISATARFIQVFIAGDASGEDFIVDGGSSVRVIGIGPPQPATGTVSTNSANVQFFLETDNATGTLNATASIAGSITFEASATGIKTTVNHQVIGNDAGVIHFVSGGSLITRRAGVNSAQPTLKGQPFDVNNIGVMGVAVFETGATFQQEAADDPYGLAEFQAGSTYRYLAGNVGPSGNGVLTADRTYGNVDFQNASALTISGGFALTILNNLTKTITTAVPSTPTTTSSTVNINVTGTGTSIGGNIVASVGTLNFTPALASGLSVAGATTVNGGAVTFSPTGTNSAAALTGDVSVTSGSLTFGGLSTVDLKGNATNNPSGTLSFSMSPGSVGAVVAFTGTAAQSLGGTGTLTFNDNAALQINNSSAGGVTLLQPLTVTSGLNLMQGTLNTTTTNILSIPATTSIMVANISGIPTLANTSFVNGPLIRITAVSTGDFAFSITDGTGLFFPIGKGGVYRPVSLNLNQTMATATAYTAEVKMGAPPTQPFPASTASSIKRVSVVRYYEVSYDAASAFTAGQFTIYYGPDDRVDDTSKLRVAKSGSSTWADLGGFATGTATGSIISSTDATTFPDAPFTSLGNFALASTALAITAGNNPLPVELTHFTIEGRANGLEAKWTTVTEKNSAHFEVQRSATGQGFQPIATVAAQGYSAATHSYAALDRFPLTGLAYYRLRQVDVDGTASFSPVVTAHWHGTTLVGVYPNPSHDALYLTGLTGTVRYRVFNGPGQVLRAGETNAATGVDVRQLPTGLYFLETVTEEGRHTHRFERD